MCIVRDRNDLISIINNSFTFKLSLSSKELFHSNFLAWIADVEPKLFQDLIVGFINEKRECEETTPLDWGNNWKAEREYHNYDLCVIDNIDDPDAPEIKGDIRLILENKVKSIPYKAQLDQYKKEVEQSIFSKINFHRRSLHRNKYSELSKLIKDDSGKYKENLGEIIKLLETKDYRDNKYVHLVSKDCNEAIKKLNGVRYVLLTLTEDFPEKDKIIESGWQVISYKSYAEFLNDFSKAIMNEKFKTVCSDYYDFINSFNSLFETWSKDKRFKYYKRSNTDDKKVGRDYFDSYLEAKKLRIHDIYLKQKVSVMATNIYNILRNNNFGLIPQIVFGKDDSSILKKEDEALLGVGYGYIHGEPLVEIKYKPKGEVYMFIIQIQGDAYEHGIIWKDTDPQKCWKNATKVSNIQHWLSIDETLKDSKYTDHVGNKTSFVANKDLFTTDTIFPEKPNTRTKNHFESDSSEYNESKGGPYYKYKSENSFVYQSLDLKDEVMMSDIESYMVDDIYRIINLHNNQ